MHQHERFLAQDDEERVHELGDLRDDPQEAPIAGGLVRLNLADVRVRVCNQQSLLLVFFRSRTLDSVLADHSEEGGSGEQEAEQREDGQERVPQDQRRDQIERLPISLDPLDREDRNDVEGDRFEEERLVIDEPLLRLLVVVLPKEDPQRRSHFHC